MVKVLSIDFPEDKKRTLEDWKRLCIFRRGHGAIKRTIIEFIEKDLKELEEMQ